MQSTAGAHAHLPAIVRHYLSGAGGALECDCCYRTSKLQGAMKLYLGRPLGVHLSRWAVAACQRFRALILGERRCDVSHRYRRHLTARGEIGGRDSKYRAGSISLAILRAAGAGPRRRSFKCVQKFGTVQSCFAYVCPGLERRARPMKCAPHGAFAR